MLDGLKSSPELQARQPRALQKNATENSIVEERVIANGQPAGILATGSYLPEQVVANTEIAEKVGVSADWIERKTQICARRYAAQNEATSDLAARAAENALERAELAADRIDYIIVATSTPDSPQPPTAALVQSQLGAHRAACFDINVVCSGFVYGVALAAALQALNTGTYALVIGADLYSRILNFGDRATAVLLGDGAGAALVGQVPPDRGILKCGLHTQGEAHEMIRVEAGGTRVPTSYETVDSGGHFFTMRGRDVSAFVLDEVPPAM